MTTKATPAGRKLKQQAALDRAVAWMRRPGAEMCRSERGCHYIRGTNRCLIGADMTPEMAKQAEKIARTVRGLESSTAEGAETIRSFVTETYGDVDFADALQRCHDSVATVPETLANLERLADHHGLTFPTT